MYSLQRLKCRIVRSIFCGLLVGQSTFAVADDVDALLNEAQNTGNLHLKKANQEVRSKLNAADSSYRESLEKNQSLHDSLASSHNAVINRQNELAALKRQAKQQAAYNQAMMASSNQSAGQPIYVPAGTSTLQVAGSSASTNTSNSNGGNSSLTLTSTPAAMPKSTPDNISYAVVNRGYITTTNPNTYYVDVKNTGNVKESCIVIFDFQHPNGVGGLKSDRVSLPKLLNVGEVGRVKLQLSYYNVSVNEYRVSCQKWAFA